MSELLKRSIEKLSAVVNVSTGLAHPLDESRAKELLKALRDENEPLSYEEVRQYALDNHWPERHANDLATLAETIGNGGRVVISHPRGWGEQIVARLKEEITTHKV